MAIRKSPAYPSDAVRIPTMLVRAAQACSATDDFRRMLTGICLLPDGYVQSANGYVAFRGATHTHDIEPIQMQQVLMIHGKVPASRATCEFEWHDADHGTVRCIDTLKGDKPDVLAAFEVLHEVRDVDEMADEIFPDLGKLFAYRPLEDVTTIGMMSTALTFIAKTFGPWAACTLNFHGTEGSVVVQPLSDAWSAYTASMLVMPTSAIADDESEPVSTVGDAENPLDNWHIEFPAHESEAEKEVDALYDQVVELVKESRKASVSYIQRNMKIGYNRAARIVEQLEADGVVSAVMGNGTREVLG